MGFLQGYGRNGAEERMSSGSQIGICQSWDEIFLPCLSYSASALSPIALSQMMSEVRWEPFSWAISHSQSHGTLQIPNFSADIFHDCFWMTRRLFLSLEENLLKPELWKVIPVYKEVLDGFFGPQLTSVWFIFETNPLCALPTVFKGCGCYPWKNFNL